MHNKSARRPDAWIGSLVFENLKTMIKVPVIGSQKLRTCAPQDDLQYASNTFWAGSTIKGTWQFVNSALMVLRL